MVAADWKLLFSSWIHLMVSVLPSTSEHVSHVCRSGFFFSFGTTNSYWCVCSYLFSLLGTTVADRKCLMKVMYKGKVLFYEKLFTCVFLLMWPRPPMLEGTLLQAFPFWISFFWVLLFLFHFQPSCISSKFKRPLFLLWFWLQQFLFFQHLRLNLEILMPKIMTVFPLISNHLVLQHQIIEIFFRPPTSSAEEHFSLLNILLNLELLLCFVLALYIGLGLIFLGLCHYKN